MGRAFLPFFLSLLLLFVCCFLERWLTTVFQLNKNMTLLIPTRLLPLNTQCTRRPLIDRGVCGEDIDPQGADELY